MAHSPCQGAPRGSILAGSAREGFLRCVASGATAPRGGGGLCTCSAVCVWEIQALT